MTKHFKIMVIHLKAALQILEHRFKRTLIQNLHALAPGANQMMMVHVAVKLVPHLAIVKVKGFHLCFVHELVQRAINTGETDLTPLKDAVDPIHDFRGGRMVELLKGFQHVTRRFRYANGWGCRGYWCHSIKSLLNAGSNSLNENQNHF